jgi:hypothetical protein
MYLDSDKLRLSVARFSGGMNRFDDSSVIGEDQYVFLSNGRVRDGRIRPVKNPLRLQEGLPVGIEGITVRTITEPPAPREIAFFVDKWAVGGSTIIEGSAIVILDGADITSACEITQLSPDRIDFRYSHLWLSAEVHTITIRWQQTNVGHLSNPVFEKLIYYGQASPATIQIAFSALAAIEEPSINFTVDGIDVTFTGTVISVAGNSGTIAHTPNPAFTFGTLHTSVVTFRDVNLVQYANFLYLETASFLGTTAGEVATIEELIARGALNVQGIFTAQNYMIVFIMGKAYYKNYANPLVTEFTEIPGFQMSPTAPRIYSWLVPGSTVNFTRVASTNTPNATIGLGAAGIATNSCLICQDGVNRPQLIFTNAQTRAAKSFAEWSLEDREYVPIGLMGIWFNGKNYIVSKDRKRIMHSVTGRPLDFVIAVDEDTGDKLGDAIFDEEADRLAHQVDYEEIVALKILNTNSGGGFYVSTLNTSYIVSPNYENLLWGEPTFDQTFLFSTGALNENSITDSIGDTALINASGIRSFNAVLQSQNEGKNTPLHASIANLFGPEDNPIEQDVTASIAFNDYLYFAVNTIFGYGILIYDTTRASFVSLDQFPEMSAVRQFAVLTRSGGDRRLFALDNAGRVWELYGNSTVATCKFYVRDWSTSDPELLQIPRRFKAVFENIEDDGIVTATVFCDKFETSSSEETLEQNILPIEFPVQPPFGGYQKDTIENLTFTFQTLPECWKAGILLEWSVMADLVTVGIVSEVEERVSSIEQQAKNYANN